MYFWVKIHMAPPVATRPKGAPESAVDALSALPLDVL